MSDGPNSPEHDSIYGRFAAESKARMVKKLK